MIQPTHGPGSPDPNERSGVPAGPRTNVNPSTGTPPATPAQRRDAGGSSREDPARGPTNATGGPGSKQPSSPGSTPKTNVSGDCCDPKSRTKDHPNHPGMQLNSPATERNPASSPTGRPAGDLPTPSQDQGIRQVKGDDNRSSQMQASGDPRSGDRSLLREDRSQSVRASKSAEPPHRPAAPPQDPPRPDHDTPRPQPTQPDRPATMDPPTGRDTGGSRDTAGF